MMEIKNKPKKTIKRRIIKRRIIYNLKNGS